MPASSEVTVELPGSTDLHARPAADFVRTAMGFASDISVRADGREANAKSMTAVLALGARGGTALALHAEGDDAAAAVDALAGCVTTLE